MRMPHRKLSPATLFERYGIHLTHRLRLVPELAEISGAFDEVQEPLRAAIEAYDAGVRKRRERVAVRSHHRQLLAHEIRLLSFAILAEVDNNRDSVLYVRYFPEGLTSVLRSRIDRQRLRVIRLLTTLDSEPVDAVRVQLDPLRSQLAQLEAAMEEVSAALDDEARLRSRLASAKLDWLRGYRRTYQQLRHHYRQNPRDADRFLWREEPRRSSDDADEMGPT